MRYRTQTEVADTLRRIADGNASADPLRVGDAAELERLAAWVEDRSELQAELRVRMERGVLAAYSLGARHALERMRVNPDGEGTYDYADERVNLATGEITTVTDEEARRE